MTADYRKLNDMSKENAVKTILDVAVKIFKWILSFIIGR